jgi:transposase InsO family protein
MKETAALSKECRFPLLGAIDYPIRRGMEGYVDAVKVVDMDDEPFWARITRVDRASMLHIVNIDGLTPKALNAMNTSMPLGQSLTPESVRLMDKEKQKEALKLLHLRLGHATGAKLRLTLIEKGWGRIYTEADCKKVSCEVCRLMNRKKLKIPQVQDKARGELKPGELAYQDLTSMPVGVGNFPYISVVVDAHTRRVGVAAIKNKSDAILHAMEWVRKMEKEGFRVKRWHSDNGGEFVNDDYKEFFKKEGIHQTTGAPYTPQSQGIVERANGRLKRLMGKTMRSIGVPIYLWPAFLPGVVQAMNSVVHAVHGSSPYAKAGLARGSEMPKLAVGDVISVVNPKDKAD